MKSLRIKFAVLAVLLLGILACGGVGGDTERLAGTWTESSGKGTATFTSDTYTRDYDNGGNPIVSSYAVKSVDGDQITISVVLTLDGGKKMPVDDQIITITGDTMKMANAENGGGGSFKRAGSGDDKNDEGPSDKKKKKKRKK